jgi:molybdate transport system ATP-binding protein
MLRAERENRVRESLAWLGLEELAGRRPAEISGGQQQRAALARAVVRRPKLLLLDEPLAALDAPTRRQLRGELHALLSRAGIPAVVVTHDPAEALALADTLVLMHEGKILQSGAPYDIFHRPASIEAARILGVDSVVAGVVESCEDQLAGVRAAGAVLLAFSQDLLPSGTPVSVCIRAEDVVLTRPGAPSCSARNRLSGVVSDVVGEGGLVRVGIDCGFPLRAVLTRQSSEEMELRPGSLVEARIKAPNVHLIRRMGSCL